MSGDKDYLKEAISNGSEVTRVNVLNASHLRICRDAGRAHIADAERLPRRFSEKDMDLVRKEVRMLGFELQQAHPGYMMVIYEGPDFTARVVAGYGRRWHEEEWELQILEVL
jgi:hypothetical protein